MISKLVTVFAASTALGAVAAPAAADTVNSANWAGYAVHRSGVTFSKVVGAWRQPRPTCIRGQRTYSAMWVGLGGYSISAQALEQIGTEADCSGSGGVVSSAWYEQVPAPSNPIRLRVRPGDSLMASVSVAGRQVQLRLSDRTSHKSFVKTLRASLVDVSSAEWIVEAPSECSSLATCVTLPLANFRSARFTSADARASTGHTGTISDRRWNATRIRLAPDGRQFVFLGGVGNAAGAMPSTLSQKGTSFVVRYSAVTAARRAAAATVAAARRAAAPAVVPGGRLFH